MTQSNDIAASEYVLGMLSQSERTRVEERIPQDPNLAARIAWWSDCFLPLSTAGAESPPPDSLFAQIEGHLDRESDAGGGGSVTIRDEEGQWFEISPGARKKHLYYDERSRSEAYLLELAPGCQLSQHEHDGTEDCLVLSGDFSIGDLRLKAGDFHAAFIASIHAPIRSEMGCRLFIKAAA